MFLLHPYLVFAEEANQQATSTVYETTLKDSNSLSSFLTVIALLIATTGFIFGVVPKSPTKTTYNPYKKICRSLLIACSVLIALGFFLIIITGEFYLHIVAFSAVVIPVSVLWHLVETKV